MPPATGLEFYRKRQTINHLTLERPQSLAVFRECVANGLHVIDGRLELLRQSYYGHETPEAEVKRWLPVLETVLKQAHISFFLCKTQLSDTITLYHRARGDPTMKVDFDKEAIKKAIECIDRNLKYLKTGFADIVRDMKALVTYMEKYCLSFFTTEGDFYLDTAINYERQRKEFSTAIRFNIDDIVNMAESFENKGLRVAELGFVARDLAARCNCSHVPFLVIIPQAFENLKNAISGIQRWLKADEGYADFIHYDIQEMEEKKETQGKKFRDMQVKSSNCEHKIKTLKREHGDCVADVERFHNREMSLTREKASIIKQNKDVLVDLDIKHFRREEIKHRVDEMTEYELDNFHQLEQEIAELEVKRPNLERKLEDIDRKLVLIAERRDGMLEKEKQIVEAKKESRVVKKELRKAEVELERIEVNMNKLKEIYRYKTTPEVLKKIFHNMPLTARHVANKGKKPILDNLERACKLTSTLIEGDWSRLYRELPFHPPRGEQTVSGDIDEIGKQFMRHTSDELCKQALWRWRRMHTRASVDDLKKALLAIRRKDIVDEIIEEVSKRSSKPNVLSPSFRTVRFPKLAMSATS